MSTGGIVIFAPNWLGDAVMALPAVAAVRLGRQGTPVTVAARPAVAPLFDLVDGVTVARLERGSGAVDMLRQGRFDTAVLLPNSLNVARLARQAGIGERWGYAADFRSLLLTRAIARPSRLHQVESYRHLARALGFPDADPVPRIDLTAALREEGRTRLIEAGWDGARPLVAMAPGAAFGTAKRWPAASFAALADRYAQRGVATLMLGSAADAGAGAEVIANLQPPTSNLQPPTSTLLLDLMGRTDLRMLAAVLVQAQTLVTNDSGAMHLAAALGVNVTAMFGPTIATETHPLGRGRTAVVSSSVWCRPCMLRECPLTHRCMREITVDRVLASSETQV